MLVKSRKFDNFVLRDSKLKSDHNTNFRQNVCSTVFPQKFICFFVNILCCIGTMYLFMLLVFKTDFGDPQKVNY